MLPTREMATCRVTSTSASRSKCEIVFGVAVRRCACRSRRLGYPRGARISLIRFELSAGDAVDIDLEQPVVLSVKVSVHVCTPCRRTFRAQPPFLRPRAIYSQRVVQKAVEAVYSDGLAARCVPDRLARDFWVKPNE